MTGTDDFTEEQKTYLQGFVAGTEAARTARGLPPLFAGNGAPAAPAAPAAAPAAPSGPEAIHRAAQDRMLAEGRALTNEEKAKREKNPFDMWDEMRANAAGGAFPKGTDVFLYKYHGLFYVAPAQDSFMCRLRIPNGILNAHQFRGLADLAERFGGGYAHVTTRANLQIREIAAAHALDVLEGLYDLGLAARGAGADNIRNITGSPTAGIDPQERIDTRPLARELHHYILNHRELYGLPRKFNIAFDGGGTIAVLEDTNDIGFAAVQVGEGKAVPPGVYFRLALGGITGHRDFARDTGILVAPADCTPVAAAMLRVFIEHGDRTDRRKARLKYLLDRWGFDRFLAETEKVLGRPLIRLPLADCAPRGPALKHRHIGVHPQRQPGLVYVGVVLPVGKLTGAQMRGLAAIAERHGSATLRLTVWQNLLISDIPEDRIALVQREIEALGLHWSATSIRAGLIACTGNTGCRFSASDTKGHAAALADYLDERLQLDQPVNIHLTGCHNSCAQHYIGDIGLLGAKVETGAGDDVVEGYHVYIGGGYGEDAAVGRELCRDVPFAAVPPLIERLLRAYLAGRSGPDETFCAFARRHDTETLLSLCAQDRAEAA